MEEGVEWRAKKYEKMEIKVEVFLVRVYLVQVDIDRYYTTCQRQLPCHFVINTLQKHCRLYSYQSHNGVKEEYIEKEKG